MDTVNKKKLVFLTILIIIVTFITGCTNSSSSLNSTSKDDSSELKTKLVNLESELVNTKNELANSKNQINQLQNTIQKLQLQADSSTAYELMRKSLSDPNILSNQIADKIIDSNNILKPLKTQISGVVSSVIRSKIPSVNWVKNSISLSSGRTYQTSMKSVFPIEIETGIPVVGKVVIGKIEVIANALVNVETESVYNIQSTINVVSNT